MAVVGYLGPKGSFTYVALKDFLNKHHDDWDMQDFLTIPSVIEALKKKEIDYGFVPFENSIEGVVTQTVDQLICHDGVVIQAEWVMPICLALMGTHDATLHTLKQVVSHPQPLAQCAQYLAQTLPHAQTSYRGSTSQAVQEVTHSGIAVVGHPILAQLFGLTILADHIEDHASNCTRFFKLGSDICAPGSRDRTSFVLWIPDRAGALEEVLRVFAMQGINLTSISSRPTKTQLGRYVFWLECEGHISDASLRCVLSVLSEKQCHYRCLGSYPRFEECSC